MRIIYGFLFLMFSLNTFAQDGFERFYRVSGERTLRSIDLQTAPNGDVVGLFTVVDEDGSQTQANLTRFDPKGNISWSRDYDFDTEIFGGNLALYEPDSFLFSISTTEQGLNRVVTLVTPGGAVVWSHIVGNPDGIVFPNVILHGGTVLGRASKIAMVSNTGTFVSMANGFYAAQLDSTGIVEWAGLYDLSNLDNEFMSNASTDLIVTLDSNYLLSSQFLEIGDEIDWSLTKLDTSGNILWSKGYGIPSDFDFQQIEAIAATPDSGYVAVGVSLTGDFPPFIDALIVKFDSIGNIDWHRTVNVDSTFMISSGFSDVVVDSEGNITASGNIIRNGGTEFFPFAMQFSPSGNHLSSQEYSSLRTNTNRHTITLVPDGFTQLTNTITPTGETLPYLINTAGDLSSSCSDTISFEFNDFLDFQITDLEFIRLDLDSFIVNDLEAMEYDSFAIPVLALDSAPPFCEGDPINVTFDATVDEAVSYQWNTGETTPMITATEEGMYIVDVRIEDEVCFTLCDTTVIAIIGPPNLNIQPELGFFCRDGFGLLNAVGGGAASIVWQPNGATTESIQVDESDVGTTFTVTAENQCGTDEAEYFLEDFPNPIPLFGGLLADTTGICLGRIANLRALDNTANTWEWSTSDGNIVGPADLNEIDIDSVGTYTLTVSNFCESASNSITIFGERPDPMVVTEIACDSSLIQVTDLQNNTTGGTISLLDEDGVVIVENDTEFVVEETGTYTVVSANECFETEVPVVIEFTEFIESLFMIPNAFSPNGDSQNDIFRPFLENDCDLEAEITKFTVYNRWGSEVYSAIGPIEQIGWDGRNDGEPAVSDVYIYRIEIRLENGEVLTWEGDVTLVR